MKQIHRDHMRRRDSERKPATSAHHGVASESVRLCASVDEAAFAAKSLVAIAPPGAQPAALRDL